MTFARGLIIRPAKNRWFLLKKHIPFKSMAAAPNTSDYAK